MVLAGFYQSKAVLAAETVLLTLLPLAMLNFFPHWLQWRQYVMAGGLVYVTVFFYSERFTRRQLGIQSHNFFQAVKSILGHTVIASGIIYAAYWFFRLSLSVPVIMAEISVRPALLTALRYIFISVPLQEILYRVYLVNRTERVLRRREWVRLYSALIFALVHTPFNNLYLTIGSFILGWWWSGNYLQYKNVFSVVFSHSVIGLAYILLMT